MGFQNLNVSKQILMALGEAGFENPTPIQEEVFSVSRSGRDLIGIAPTGTGKQLAYLIPMLMKLHYAQGLVQMCIRDRYRSNQGLSMTLKRNIMGELEYSSNEFRATLGKDIFENVISVSYTHLTWHLVFYLSLDWKPSG